MMNDNPPRAVADLPSTSAAYDAIADILTHLSEIVRVSGAAATAAGSGSSGSGLTSSSSGNGSQPVGLGWDESLSNFVHSQKLHGRATFASALHNSIISAYPPTAAIIESKDPTIVNCVNDVTRLLTTSVSGNGALVGGGVMERIIVVTGGYNRSLERRWLGKIVRELEEIQAVVEGIDGFLHERVAEIEAGDDGGSIAGFFRLKVPETSKKIIATFYFSSWIYELKLWVLELYFQLGFELDLYTFLTLEPSYMDHIYETYIAHMNRMASISAEARSGPLILELLWQFQQQTDLAKNAAASAPTFSKKGSKSKKNSGAGSKAIPTYVPKPITLDAFATKFSVLVSERDVKEAQLVVRQLVGRANMMFSFATATGEKRVVREPQYPFFSAEITYNQRFRAVLQLGSPVPQGFSDYRASEAAFSEIPSGDLLQRSIMFYEEARVLIEFLMPFGDTVCAGSVTLKKEQK
ncbi:hypothetical protein HK100_009459, partial [Physocladia obscura]